MLLQVLHIGTGLAHQAFKMQDVLDGVSILLNVCSLQVVVVLGRHCDTQVSQIGLILSVQHLPKESP